MKPSRKFSCSYKKKLVYSIHNGVFNFRDITGPELEKVVFFGSMLLRKVLEIRSFLRKVCLGKIKLSKMEKKCLKNEKSRKRYEDLKKWNFL